MISIANPSICREPMVLIEFDDDGEREWQFLKNTTEEARNQEDIDARDGPV